MVEIDTELTPSSWPIGILWAGVSAISICAGILLGTFLNGILWTPLFPPGIVGIIVNPIQRALVIGLCIGGIKSILETIVLQTARTRWNGWIIASMLGWAVGVTVTTGLAVFHSSRGIDELLGGMIIGFSQWVVLKRYLPKSYWWIIANVIGSFLILSWIPLGYTFFMMLESFVFFIVAGLFMGIFTGTTLSWLLTLSWLEDD